MLLRSSAGRRRRGESALRLELSSSVSHRYLVLFAANSHFIPGGGWMRRDRKLGIAVGSGIDPFVMCQFSFPLDGGD